MTGYLTESDVQINWIGCIEPYDNDNVQWLCLAIYMPSLNTVGLRSSLDLDFDFNFNFSA